VNQCNFRTSRSLDLINLSPWTIGSETCVDFLRSSGCVESLFELDITVSTANVVALGDFVRHLGPQLKHLQIRFARRFGDTDTAISLLLDNFDLAKNLDLLQRVTFDSPAHPATRTLLSRIVSPHIRIITFNNWPFLDLTAVLAMHPELLERSLSSPNLSRLAEVRLMLSGVSSLPFDVKAAYQNVFPDLQKRGILRVARVYE